MENNYKNWNYPSYTRGIQLNLKEIETKLMIWSDVLAKLLWTC